MFRTEYTPKKGPFSLSHSDTIFCMGSCFAEHLFELLNSNKFNTILNPFGILYNPHSIAVAFKRLIQNQPYSKEELISWGDLWHSFDHHGHFSALSAEKSLEKMNANLKQGAQFLKKANRILITLGTANVFLYRATEKIVANCHKIPGSHFDRVRINQQQIVAKLAEVFLELKRKNESLEIILTVSPVRHIRDGLIENQRSKAVLLLSVEELTKKMDFVHYFPSYEILVDDLRDYRFYKSDLIHPTDFAVQYIWNQFQATYLDKETKDVLKAINPILYAIQHRPLFPESDAHRQFLENLLQKISVLEGRWPIIKFDLEKEEIYNRLEKLA